MDRDDQHRVLAELLSDIRYAYTVSADGRIRREWLAGHGAGLETALPVEAMAEECWGTIVHPDDRPIVRARTRRLLDGQCSTDEFRVRLPAERPRWLRVYGYPERDEAEGRVIRIIGCIQDITAQKEAEAQGKELLAVAEQQAGQFRALAEAFRLTMSAEGLEAKLAAIADRARAIIGAHHAIASMTRGPDWSRAISAVSLSERYARYRDEGAVPDGSGIHAEVCRTNRVVRMTQAELDAHPLQRDLGGEREHRLPMRGWLAAPLVARDGSNLGLVQLSDKYEGEFALQDETTLIQLAQFASVAIENARIYEALRESERRLTDIAANFPGVIYRRVLHPDGRLSYAYMSEGANTLLKAQPSDFHAMRPPEEHARRFVPEDRGRWLDTLKRSAAELSLFDVEARVVGNDGSIRWVHALAYPRRRSDGTVIWDGMSLDITDRKQAEAALRESEQRFRDVAESSSDWIWETDPENCFTYVSARIAEVTGQPHDQFLGKTVEEVMAAGVAPERIADHLADLRARRPFRNFVYWIDRPIGRRCCSISGTPRFDSDGYFLGYRGVGSDITERQLAAERQGLLMAELDHRVKNTLAVVQSIAAHSLPATEGIEAFRGRLAALAQAHTLLAERKWEGAELRTLLSATLAPYRSADAQQVALAGDDMLLAPKAAQVLAMTMHELAANAAKYGALSMPGGRLAVTWRVEEVCAVTGLLVEWVEQGGPPVREPSRRGFGSALITQTVAYELGGEVRLEFRPEGVRCDMMLPLAEAKASARSAAGF